MAKKLENPELRLEYVAGSVSQLVFNQILALSKKWGMNKARTVGRMLREWTEEHIKEIPSLKKELEEKGQKNIEELL
jgi:hypothetical protein